MARYMLLQGPPKGDVGIMGNCIVVYTEDCFVVCIAKRTFFTIKKVKQHRIIVITDKEMNLANVRKKNRNIKTKQNVSPCRQPKTIINYQRRKKRKQFL